MHDVDGRGGPPPACRPDVAEPLPQAERGGRHRRARSSGSPTTASGARAPTTRWPTPARSRPPARTSGAWGVSLVDRRLGRRRLRGDAGAQRRHGRLLPPPAGSDIVGAPKLKITYKGNTLPPNTYLFAQIVDRRANRVVGSQVTPLPVILDDRVRTVERDAQPIAARASADGRSTACRSRPGPASSAPSARSAAWRIGVTKQIIDADCARTHSILILYLARDVEGRPATDPDPDELGDSGWFPLTESARATVGLRQSSAIAALSPAERAGLCGAKRRLIGKPPPISPSDRDRRRPGLGSTRWGVFTATPFLALIGRFAWRRQRQIPGALVSSAFSSISSRTSSAMILTEMIRCLCRGTCA